MEKKVYLVSQTPKGDRMPDGDYPVAIVFAISIDDAIKILQQNGYLKSVKNPKPEFDSRGIARIWDSTLQQETNIRPLPHFE